MAYNEKSKARSMQYAKEHYKRIPLDVLPDKYNAIKAAAGASGETVNGYIKQAIDERMERENNQT